MPYMNATIFEVQRMSATAPGVLPHRTLADTTLEGYDIPKDTVVLVNVKAILRDPDFWTDPDDFRPERFLNESGQIIKPEPFIPFGIGKRICLGETLAKRELFIFSVVMVQKMSFLLTQNHPTPDPGAATAGVTRIPLPFYVQIKPR